MYQLGIVKNIVEEAGMGISYAYEDLVFLDHNSFLLQFTDNDLEVLIHVNQETEKEAIAGDISRMQEIAVGEGMQFVKGIEYILGQDEEANVTIEFIES